MFHPLSLAWISGHAMSPASSCVKSIGAGYVQVRFQTDLTCFLFSHLMGWRQAFAKRCKACDFYHGRVLALNERDDEASLHAS